MPSLAATRERNRLRSEDAKHPGQAASRRMRTAIARSMVEAGPGQFGQFATTQWAQMLLRARWDVDYFCEALLGFIPHPGQRRLFRAYILRDETRWMARNLTICAAAGNRAGKTLGLAVVILHSVLFKMGKKPPNPLDDRDVERWMRLGYDWYHFGVHSEVAELVYHEIIRLLQGTHEAQRAGCPLTTYLGTEVADWSKKYRGEYPMIVMHPSLGSGTIHFRTTGERAIGSLGKDMDGESFDEAPFEPNFDFVIDEVLHMRRLSTGGQMFLIGTTTEGLVAFADKWAEGDPDNPGKQVDTYSLRISTRENIGFGIDQRMFDRLVASMPSYLIPQNIDGYFIESRAAFFGAESVKECFVEELPGIAPAQRGHRYVQGCDPAISYDSSWSIVLDTTAGEVWTGVCVGQLSGRQTHLTVAGLLLNTHNAYNAPDQRTTCISGLDATGFGGKVFRDILPINVRAVEFGGTKRKKLGLLNQLKKAIESGRLRFPASGKWLGLRRQLLGYKLDDKKIEQDAVMALAVAVDVARRNPGAMEPEGEFDFFGGSPAGYSPGADLLARLQASQRE